MGKPLSIDLYSRLIATVAGGLSPRSAAERFGVSAATAVRWVHAVNTTGTVQAKPQGGDTRSHHIEAFSGIILAAVRRKRTSAWSNWLNCCAPSTALRSGPARSGAALIVTA